MPGRLDRGSRDSARRKETVRIGDVTRSTGNWIAAAAAVALAVAGCVRMPTGPDVRVMPAPYKPFEVFAEEDDQCRARAASRVREFVEPPYDDDADAADESSWDLQRRYDWTYEQCMYAKGNQVPGFAPVEVPAPPATLPLRKRSTRKK